MECPVSLERMTVPRVLPCGHTFDEDSLRRVRRCPLCRRRFNCRPRDLPINWILTNIDPELYYDIIRSITRDEHTRVFRMNMDQITWDLLCMAEKGVSGVSISCSNIFGCQGSMKPKILDMISQRLQEMGFVVIKTEQPRVSCWGSSRSHPSIIISWNKDDL